jgi:hypothetical protein
MPRPIPPHERGYYRDMPPHEEIIEHIDRRFDELMSELAEIKRKLR